MRRYKILFGPLFTICNSSGPGRAIQRAREPASGVTTRCRYSSISRWTVAVSQSGNIIRKCLGFQDIMEEWAEHFKMCQLIFYRATSGNKKVLFGAKGSVIEKNDERLRTIPFQTRRATFKEVKRIHEMLCRVEILGNASDVKNVVSKDVNKLEKSPKKKPHRSKSREDPVRPLPVPEICDEEEGNETSEELRMVTEQVSTLGLAEFDSSIQSKKIGRKNKNKKSKMEATDEDAVSDDGVLKKESLQTKLQNDLLTAVKSGDNQMLQNLIASVDTMVRYAIAIIPFPT